MKFWVGLCWIAERATVRAKVAAVLRIETSPFLEAIRHEAFAATFIAAVVIVKIVVVSRDAGVAAPLEPGQPAT